MPALAWTPSARLKQAALERAQPLSASLELTYRCNWRCVFCYNPRHHDRRGLTGAEWGAVLDDLRALGTLYVALTGGEPLTHPEFLAIARGVRERAFALRILTNGALVTDTLAGDIAALRPMAVELSLHGATAETHDRATATPGSFDAMLRGLDRLLARKVGVVLKTPLTTSTRRRWPGCGASPTSAACPGGSTRC
jgi:MoaA/NifB/PqqE/SkfB family radical SAM enzyme